MARKNSVDIIIKAKDQASKKFSKIGKSAGGMGSMLKKAAAGALIYFSGRAIKNFAAESLRLYGRQEEAVRGLADALALLGIKDKAAIKDMAKFASGIQSVTKYGDEAVLELMTMGATMGKLSGGELKRSTKAAIGLAKAFKVDVVAAMRLVARAAVGDTTTLTRYGIKLGDAKTTQDKFNKVLDIGTRNFKLAEQEATRYLGIIEQTKNVLGDVKEVIGEALMPVFKEWAKKTKTWAENNMDSIGAWAKKTVAFLGVVKDVFWDFISFMKSDWRSGLQFALDAMLSLLKATFETAVALAIAGGKGIWAGVKKGLSGSGAGVHKAAVAEYEKQGGTFTRERIKSRGPLQTLSTRHGNRIDDPAKFAAIKAQLEQEQTRADINKMIKTPMAVAMQSFANAAGDIGKNMPPGLKTEVGRSMAKYQARLLDISQPGETSSGYAGGVSPGGFGGGSTVKNKVLTGGTRGKLAAAESRFLTMRAGGTLDIEKKTEKNTAAAVAVLKKIDNGIGGLIKKIDNPSAGINIKMSNFA